MTDKSKARDIRVQTTPPSTDKDGDEKDALAGAPKALIFPALNAIFQPTAELLGVELRGWAQQKINENKKRRLDAHAERVRANLGDRKVELTSEQQLHLFEKWAEGASEVEPDDEVAAAWQAILEGIATNDPKTELLLDKLRSLSTDEAQYLAQFQRRGLPHILIVSDYDRHYLTALKRLGLVTTGPSGIQLSLLISLAFALALSVLLGQSNAIALDDVRLFSPIALSLFFVAGGLTFFVGRYRLSWLGRELSARMRRKTK